MLFGPWLCHSSVDYGSVDAGVNAALNVFFRLEDMSRVMGQD